VREVVLLDGHVGPQTPQQVVLGAELAGALEKRQQQIEDLRLRRDDGVPAVDAVARDRAETARTGNPPSAWGSVSPLPEISAIFRKMHRCR
jgi:hypothetical protein